jgi:hypothetical protein
VTEYFLDRRKRRGSNRDKPEELESPEEIGLAVQREGVFDQRSRRKAREQDDHFSLVERKVGLVVRTAMSFAAMIVAGSSSIAAAVVALGGGGGWGAWAAWKRRRGGRDDD